MVDQQPSRRSQRSKLLANNRQHSSTAFPYSWVHTSCGCIPGSFMKRREEISQHNLLSVLVDDPDTHIVFAWRRVKKLLGSYPSFLSVSRGKPGEILRAAHTAREEVVLSGVGITPAISGPILGETASGHFQAEPFHKQSDFPRPGPCQGRRSVAEPSAAVPVDRVAGGSIIALAEMVSSRGPAGRWISGQAPSGISPFSEVFARGRPTAGGPARRLRCGGPGCPLCKTFLITSG